MHDGTPAPGSPFLATRWVSEATGLISRTALRESSGCSLIGISEQDCFFNDYEDLR
jgi:hypothetical protein